VLWDRIGESAATRLRGIIMSFLTKILQVPRKEKEKRFSVQNLEGSSLRSITKSHMLLKYVFIVSEASSSRLSRPRDGRRNTGSTLSVPQTPTSRTSISSVRSGGDNRVYNGPRLDASLQWLRSCGRDHRCCTQMAQQSTYRPARLIDLGVDFDFKRAYLVESTSVDPLVEYLALSYCWGTSMPDAAKTTRATLAENKVRLKRGKLPRTFRHFFEIARCLNVRYIWIDSLCIIQDSTEDWLREVAAMGRIYAGAVCTIAAESAKDCSGGIWLEPRLRTVNDSHSPTYEDMTQEDNIRNYLSVCDQRFHKSPLQNRGWSLQEREVSHRILHFTFAHIFWECREAKIHSPILLGESDTFVGSQAGIRESAAEWKNTRLRALDIPLEFRADPHSASSQRAISPIFPTHLPPQHVAALSPILSHSTTQTADR